MITIEDTIFTIIMAGEFIIGVLGNGYIVLMCWIDCVKKKTPSLNYILTCLAISRICLLFIIIVGDIGILSYPDFYRDLKLVTAISAFWIFINDSSLWFSTCLNVFYLLKIVNFSCPFFLWLKWRIDRVIFWILLACLATSSLDSLLIAILSYYKEIDRLTKYQRNITDMFNGSKYEYFNPSTLSNVLAVIPFTVSLISFFLLILSLWKHTKQMKLNIPGWRDPSTEAHITAMKNVTSFLFLFFVYYGTCLLVTYRYLMKEENLVYGLGKLIIVLYPSGHSLILIIGNSKLRNASIRIWRNWWGGAGKQAV